MSARNVILMEVDVTAPDGTVGMLTFADRSIRPMPPTDATRANVVYGDRLIEPPALRRSLLEDLAGLQPGIGIGVATLANGDRGLNPWEAHLWGEVRVLRWTEGTAVATATPLFRGRAAAPVFGGSSDQVSRVRLGFHDERAALDKPLQATNYAGTGGYEGAVDGLKGRPKPLAFGRLTDAHLTLPLVDPAQLVYQWHDGAASGEVAIFDRGAAAGFGYGGNYVGAAFDAQTPAASGYITDNGRGLIKINGSPVGRVTFSSKGDASGSGYVETPGPVLARILSRAGVPAVGASVAALASAAVVGLWAGEMTAAEAVAAVARAAPAAVLPDRSGVLQATAIAPPGAPVYTIAADQVIAISEDGTAPAPAAEIRVGWGRVHTPLSRSELLESLRSTATAERLAAEYRYAVLVDAPLKARLPGAWRTIAIDTPLRLEADALALAGQLKTLFGLRPDGRPRRAWRVVIALTTEALAAPLGSSVRLVYPDLGLDEALLLTAEEPLRPRRDQLTWTLWG